MPLDDTPRYLRVVQLSSTILCGIGAFVGTSLLLGGAFGMVYSEVAPLLIFCIFPTLLASLAIWRGSTQVAAWYVRTADAHAALALRVGE